MIHTVITHDKMLHADETFGTAVLKILNPELRIIRTRNQGVLAELSGTAGVAVLDLGSCYDPARFLFDHHQPEGAGVRSTDHMLNKIESTQVWPYATAGLIWKHFGAQAVAFTKPELTPEGVGEVVSYVDEALIKYIDAIDCGVRLKSAGPSLSGLIAGFNPSWYDEDQDTDSVFELVTDLAQLILVNHIKRHAGKILARDAVRSAPTLWDGSVLVLDACLPWSDVVSQEMPDVLMVMYPTGAQWQLKAVSSPEPRIQLPQSWAGLERQKLARVSGVADAVFCHRSRHLAGASSLAGVKQMAELALLEASLDQREVA